MKPGFQSSTGRGLALGCARLRFAVMYSGGLRAANCGILQLPDQDGRGIPIWRHHAADNSAMAFEVRPEVTGAAAPAIDRVVGGGERLRSQRRVHRYSFRREFI